MKEKQNFIEPFIEIIQVEITDVIATSNNRKEEDNIDPWKI